MFKQVFKFGNKEYMIGALKLNKPGSDSIVFRAMDVAKSL